MAQRVSVVLAGLLVAEALVPAWNWNIPVAAGGQAPERARSEDATHLSCGPQTVVLDLRRTTPIGQKGDPTRLRVYRDNQEIWNLSEEAIVGVECRSLTGDGIPGLIVTTYSFGAHCCTTIYVVSLRPEPELLLQFLEGNGGGYRIHDLNADGKVQLELNDDSFAYFGGLCYVCSPARLPLVACYQDGTFADCTRQFPHVVRRSMELYWADLKDTDLGLKSGRLRAGPWRPADFWLAGPLLGIYANSVLLDQDDAGWAAVRSRVRSERVLHWFECYRPTVQQWARQREEMLHNSKGHVIWNTPACERWEPGRIS